jgi:hypothetical protein
MKGLLLAACAAFCLYAGTAHADPTCAERLTRAGMDPAHLIAGVGHEFEGSTLVPQSGDTAETVCARFDRDHAELVRANATIRTLRAQNQAADDLIHSFRTDPLKLHAYMGWAIAVFSSGALIAVLCLWIGTGVGGRRR